MKIDNWRTLKDEVERWEEFQEIEKFMIYAECEQYIDEFDDETVDRIIEAAFDIRHSTDYMSCIGIGIAIHNWLYWIFEDMEDDDIELQKIKIEDKTEDAIKVVLFKEWSNGEWR
jgi:hypothetical protein